MRRWARLKVEGNVVGRRVKMVVVIPRWVDQETDLTVHVCAVDACFERARAIRAGAHRHQAAKPRFRLGQELFGKALDRGLSALRRTKLLLRAERAFIAAGQIACDARRADTPEARCPTCCEKNAQPDVLDRC